MNEEQYRASDGINFSTLKYMKESPLDYKIARDFPKESTSYMGLGTFVDCGILTPELLEQRFVRVPRVNWRNKDEKKITVDNYAAILSEAGFGAEQIESCLKLKKDDFTEFVHRALQSTGKCPIPETSDNSSDVFTWEKGMKIIESNKNKLHLRRALEMAEAIQVPLFAECEVTGLKLKGLPDIITKGTVSDLKTIGTLGKIWYNMKAYDYRGQLAFYDYLARLNGIAKERFYLIFIETCFPYKMKVVEVDPRRIAAEHEVNIELLKRVKECEERNEWTDGSEDVVLDEYRDGDSEPLEDEESLERMEEPGQDTL